MENNKLIIKVTVNEKLFFPERPLTATNHSGVGVTCYNESNKYHEITDSLGFAVFNNLPYDLYDIVLNLENTKKIYCSMNFDENFDTVNLDIFRLQKDTLNNFSYEINDTVFTFYFRLYNADNIELVSSAQTFLYLFFNNNSSVSNAFFNAKWILYPSYYYFNPDKIQIIADEWLLGYLQKGGYESGDSCYLKAYAGNPNISVCQGDTAEDIYYYGFSDSTEVFGFVIP